MSSRSRRSVSGSVAITPYDYDSWSRRGVRDLAAEIDAIFRAPGVLVLFCAAKKVERRRAASDGLLDRVGHDHRAGAEFFQIGIISAEVVRHGVVRGEPVEDRDDAIAGAHGVHSQRSFLQHRAGDLAVNLPDDVIGEYSGHPAAAPPRFMQLE